MLLANGEFANVTGIPNACGDRLTIAQGYPGERCLFNSENDCTVCTIILEMFDDILRTESDIEVVSLTAGHCVFYFSKEIFGDTRIESGTIPTSNNILWQ